MSQQYVPKNNPIFFGKSRGDAGFPTCLIHTVRFTRIHRGSDLAFPEKFIQSLGRSRMGQVCVSFPSVQLFYYNSNMAIVFKRSVETD